MVKTRVLSDGNEMPIIGLGTWQLKAGVCERVVSQALDLGYRGFDSADVYGNHKRIGKVLQKSGLRRNEYFVTSKVWLSSLEYKDVIESCKRNLSELDLGYLDLYLIHWPNRKIPLEDTLEAMLKLKEDGFIRSIGVSNFTINHIKDVLKITDQVVVNQVEYHPSLNQENLRQFCRKNNIFLTAYSQFAHGRELKIDDVCAIAKKHCANSNQVILSWLIQKEIFVIPRSSNKNHLEQNLKSVDLKLDDDDMERLDSLNSDNRTVDFGLGDFDY